MTWSVSGCQVNRGYQNSWHFNTEYHILKYISHVFWTSKALYSVRNKAKRKNESYRNAQYTAYNNNTLIEHHLTFHEQNLSNNSTNNLPVTKVTILQTIKHNTMNLKQNNITLRLELNLLQ